MKILTNKRDGERGFMLKPLAHAKNLYTDLKLDKIYTIVNILPCPDQERLALRNRSCRECPGRVQFEFDYQPTCHGFTDDLAWAFWEV